jgi:hypothetical protein
MTGEMNRPLTAAENRLARWMLMGLGRGVDRSRLARNEYVWRYYSSQRKTQLVFKGLEPYSGPPTHLSIAPKIAAIMLRFTIRDLLWLMVAVGLLISWPMDHWRLSKAHQFAAKDRELWRTRATSLKAVLEATGDQREAYKVEWINYGKTGLKMRQIEQPILSDKERAEILSDDTEP